MADKYLIIKIPTCKACQGTGKLPQWIIEEMEAWNAQYWAEHIAPRITAGDADLPVELYDQWFAAEETEWAKRQYPFAYQPIEAGSHEEDQAFCDHCAGWGVVLTPDVVEQLCLDRMYWPRQDLWRHYCALLEQQGAHRLDQAATQLGWTLDYLLGLSDHPYRSPTYGDV